jgi:hypothetical protein
MLKISKYLCLFIFLAPTLHAAIPTASGFAETTQQVSHKTHLHQVVILKNTIAWIQKEIADEYVSANLEDYISRNEFNFAWYLINQANISMLMQKIIISNQAKITFMENNVALLDVMLNDMQQGSQHKYWQDLRAQMTLLIQQKVRLNNTVQPFVARLKNTNPLELKNTVNEIKARLRRLIFFTSKQLKEIIRVLEAKLQELVST